MFYNTNITTYLWFMTNRKPEERKGKVLLIDATNMSRLMRKNLGKKRRELTTDCVSRITKAYTDFKAMEWQENPTGAPGRMLKAQIFDREHFFYRKVTIERPLRMRFELTAEKLAAFRLDPQSNKASSKAALDHALERLCIAGQSNTWWSADAFRRDLGNAAKQENEFSGYKLAPLKSKDFEIVRKYFGTRDKAAEPCTNEKGEVLSDSELRDAEYVPFSEDIDTYFQREVVPHWPDAWVNYAITDKKDHKPGMVGTEINVNREFYVYVPPRSRAVIAADIEAKEQKFMHLLRGIKEEASQ